MAKQQTQASYQARLDRVVDHIYAHLDADIRPEGLAEIACLSPYHWHGIYVAMRGETVSATIRRLRLLRAADRLANSDLSIRTIAERAATAAPTPSGAPFARPMARRQRTIAPRAAMQRSRPLRKPRIKQDFPS
jgi:AraC family transcriptional regulator